MKLKFLLFILGILFFKLQLKSQKEFYYATITKVLLLLPTHTNEQIVMKDPYHLDLNGVGLIREVCTPANSTNLNYMRILNAICSALPSCNYLFSEYEYKGETQPWIKVVDTKDIRQFSFKTPVSIFPTDLSERDWYSKWYQRWLMRVPVLTMIGSRIDLYKEGTRVNTYTVSRRDLMRQTESKLVDRLIKEIQNYYE